MLRRQFVSVGVASAVGVQVRCKAMSSQAATLAPVHGTNAGTMNLLGDASGYNGIDDNDRIVPILRDEVAPAKKSWNAIATMYKWGYDSQTLFRQMNEDPGQWYHAGYAAVQSQYNLIASELSATLWSGIKVFTYGAVVPNVKPSAFFRRTFGKRDKNGAVHFDYEESAEMRKTEPQLFVVPHTKEHAMHQRLKNPSLPKAKEMDGLHFRRVLREAQYHLGEAIRLYMVDGVFGNDAATGTPFRIFSDSPNHAYVASISALRSFNHVSADELSLAKRSGNGPTDELGWRRPGVLVYHMPGYDFTAPRIVEEFGGPRPADLGLQNQKFIALDPYSIPMKAVMGGVLDADSLLKTTAFLCARWGFYADDKKFVTLNADAITSKDGKTLTVVIGDANDAVRSSTYLYSTRNIRIGDGLVTRCWDSEAVPAKGATTRPLDYVETSTNTIHRPLSTRVGKNSEKALSHRLLGKRSVIKGNNKDHVYTTDATQVAVAGGHLLGGKADTELIPRASGFSLANTNFIILGAKGSVTAEQAAKTVVDALAKNGGLYAEADKLSAAIAEVLAKAKSIGGEDALSKAVKGE